jgi:hypothetical protein
VGATEGAKVNKTTLFVEETMPDGRYEVVWREKEAISAAHDAMQFLVDHVSQNRLELWSKSHAESPNGFAPLAFREAGSKRVMVSDTFKIFDLE